MKPKEKKVSVELFNPITGDHWWCYDYNNTELIDGVEFIQVSRYGQDRAYLMRKDSLQKVNKPR